MKRVPSITSRLYTFFKRLNAPSGGAARLIIALTLVTATLRAAPVIDSQPESLTRYRGEIATFNVIVAGLEPLTYQWSQDGIELANATEATLTLTNVRSANAGTYQAVVTDAEGSSVSSVEVTLTIIDPTLTNSVTLTPVLDTSIFSSSSNPKGTATILAGTRHNEINDRGLLRFDLGSFPPTAVIQSAELQLTMVMFPRVPIDSNFGLYRMLRFWDATATWNNAATGMPWSAPGGLAGVDFSATSSATHFVTTDSNNEFGPTSQLAADVQSWVTDPGTNQGWMLKTESEATPGTARHFGSSESAQPPQLLLQYTTPAPPARLTNVLVEAGNLKFRFDGAPGWFYRVECRDNVEAGSWTTATNVAAGPATNPVMISVPFTGPRRFYRVIAE